MNETEFKELTKMANRVHRVRDLVLENMTPRSLIYGYTCDRKTFHVYLSEKDGVILVIYGSDRLLCATKRADEDLTLAECVPDKRLYPNKCDYEFCSKLMQAGVSLSFTMWNDAPASNWEGLRIEELITSLSPDDFKVTTDMALEDLGINAGRLMKPDDLLASLHENYCGQIGGYLRAEILDPENKGPQWLENIPLSLKSVIDRYLRFENVAVPSGLDEKLDAVKTKAITQAHQVLASLKAKQRSTESTPA